MRYAILILLLLSGCVNYDARIVAFGDSATAGYAPFLHQYLEANQNEVANEGRGGETSDKGVERLREIISFGTYPNNEVFIYWEGGNNLIDWLQEHDPLLQFSPSDPEYPLFSELIDLLGNIRNDLATAVELCHNQGWKVYVGSYVPFVPDITCSPLGRPMTEVEVDVANLYQNLINEVISDMTNNGATFIDAGNHLALSDPAMYQNCNHLNDDGNRIFAEIISNSIE